MEYTERLDAIYGRQSLDKKDSISIETQIDFCKKELTSHDNFQVYVDKGFSGKDTHRPDFERMMDDIKAGLIKRVIVYKLDRISRSTLDFSNIIDIFKKNNVEFISTNEKFDTSTPIGKAMLQIIMIFAELERETIQLRITDNYYARGKKGFFLGGRVPYGYRKVPTRIDGKKTSTFEKIEQENEILKKIFNLYSTTDLSLGKISSQLNSNKIPAPSGGNWSSSKISRILRNPSYVKADTDIYQYYKNKGCSISNDLEDFTGNNGCYLFGKTENKGKRKKNEQTYVLTIALHEGIIDSNTWLMCQYKLDNNKQIKGKGTGKHSWLSGFVKCGYCGYAMIVVSVSGHRYLYCKGKHNNNVCNGHSKPIKVNDIENIIKNKLFQKIDLLESSSIIMNDQKTIAENRGKMQIIQIQEQIEQLVKQIPKANDSVMKYINQEIDALDRKKNEIIEKMKMVVITTSNTMTTEEVIENTKNWDKLTIDQKKNICKKFLTRINIADDISVKWI